MAINITPEDAESLGSFDADVLREAIEVIKNGQLDQEMADEDHPKHQDFNDVLAILIGILDSGASDLEKPEFSGRVIIHYKVHATQESEAVDKALDQARKELVGYALVETDWNEGEFDITV